MSPSRRQQDSLTRGFSLVELLVVLTVIGVLVSFLLPSLSAARHRALGVVCMSRLKQVAMITLSYTGDFKGVAPPGVTRDVQELPDTLGGFYDVSWIGMLCWKRYIDPPPLARERKNIFLCPGNKPAFWTQGVPPSAVVSYNISQGYGVRHYSSTEQRPWTIGQGRIRMLPWNNLGSNNWGTPSEFLFVADSILYYPDSPNHLGQTYIWDPVSGVSPPSSMGMVNTRHQSTANCMFGDGSVRALAPANMYGSYGDTGGVYGKFAPPFIVDYPGDSAPSW